MATSNGFRILRTDYVGRTLSLDRLLFNAGVMSKNRTVQRRLGNISSLIGLNRVGITLNVRDMQRVYLQKQPA
jgi:hypothetical protein